MDILVNSYIKFTTQVAALIVHIEKRKHAAIGRHKLWVWFYVSYIRVDAEVGTSK